MKANSGDTDKTAHLAASGMGFYFGDFWWVCLHFISNFNRTCYAMGRLISGLNCLLMSL